MEKLQGDWVTQAMGKSNHLHLQTLENISVEARTERVLSLPKTMRRDLHHLIPPRSFAISGNRRAAISCYALGYAAILGQDFSTGDRKVPSEEASWKELWVTVFSPFLGDNLILDQFHWGQNQTLLSVLKAFKNVNLCWTWTDPWPPLFFLKLKDQTEHISPAHCLPSVTPKKILDIQ